MKAISLCALSIGVLLLIFPVVALADQFDDLAKDFWTWRASNQPLSTDDIPRIGRPLDWAPDWSASTVAKRRQALVEYERRWKQIDPGGWTIARQVDYRLIGSA